MSHLMATMDVRQGVSNFGATRSMAKRRVAASDITFVVSTVKPPKALGLWGYLDGRTLVGSPPTGTNVSFREGLHFVGRMSLAPPFFRMWISSTGSRGETGPRTSSGTLGRRLF